jgi:hypothetical protein
MTLLCGVTEVEKTNPMIFMAKASKTNSYIAAEMADKIKAVIHEYDDQIPLALALGVIRIVEMELFNAAKST